MSFVDNSAKTNWKFIGIVAILAVLIGSGILGYSYLSNQSQTISDEQRVGIQEDSSENEVLEKEERSEEIIEIVRVKEVDLPDAGLLKEWGINILESDIAIIEDSKVKPALPFIKDSKIFIFIFVETTCSLS